MQRMAHRKDQFTFKLTKMKHLFLLIALAVTFGSCTNKLQPTTAQNVATSDLMVTSFYQAADAQFSLTFSGCAIIQMDGETAAIDAQVFQLSPSEVVAEIGDGEYVNINIQTGQTKISYNGIQRTFRN